MNRFVSPVSLDVVDTVSGDGRVELACADACVAAVFAVPAAAAVPAPTAEDGRRINQSTNSAFFVGQY